MNRYFLVLLILLLSWYSASAQFVQTGQTLEYNGNSPKTYYTGVVDMHFNGASSTYGANGNFKLHFSQLSQGNVVGAFDIRIGNSDYVLFNQSSLKRWILTPDADMEVLLCKKSRIDDVIQLYTKNHVKRMDDKIQALQDTIAILKRKSSAADEEIEQLKQLRGQYEKELTYIKARAVEFAYIDETKLDSLETLKYKYMLNGDIDKAVEVGQQIGYRDISDNLLTKSRQSLIHTHESIDDLFHLIELIQQHLKNLRIKDETYYLPPYQVYRVYPFRRSNTDVSDVIDILIHIYEYLIDVYSNHLRCDELFLKGLKDMYADYLYIFTRYTDSKDGRVDGYLQTAAEYDNQYALYDIRDFKKCLSVATDSLLVEDAREFYETREDFLSITNRKDSIYCHIIDGTHDVVIARICKCPNNTILEIPSHVYHKGRKYNVKKIGRNAYDCKSDLKEIIIRDGVEKIGTNAFSSDFIYEKKIWIADIALTLPSSLKVIRKGAFEGYFIKEIEIPEGVEHIDKYAFGDWVNLDDSYSITLPSTLNYINEDSFYFSERSLADLSISPYNQHYKLIDNVLYSADSTSFVSSLIPTSIEKMYVSKYIHLRDSISMTNDRVPEFFAGYPSRWHYWKEYYELKEFVVDENNPYLFSKSGVIYDKQSCRIMVIPGKAENILILSSLCDFDNFYNIFDSPDNAVFTIWLPNLSCSIERCQMFYKLFRGLYHNPIINSNRLSSISFGYYDSNLICDERNKLSILDIKNEFIGLLNDCDPLLTDIVFEDESSVVSLAEIGCYYLSLDEFSDLGESILKHLKKDNPTDDFLLCAYYVKKNRIDEAVSSLSQVDEDHRERKIVSIAQNLYQGINGFPKDSLLMMTWLQRTSQDFHSPSSAYNIAACLERQMMNEAAIEWYKRAIEYGDRKYSSYNLALLYYQSQDYEHAFDYFSMSSDAGHGDASNSIGVMYDNGLGVPQNQNKANSYYHKAIKLGDKKYAARNLASFFYINNQLDSAIFYYNLAAEHGHADSWNQLAYFYAKGQGVKPDLKHAMECIDKALEISKKAEYYDTKGELSILQGNLSLAKKMWNEAISVDSSFVNVTNSTLKELLPYMNAPETLYTMLYELGDSLYAPVHLGNIAIEHYNSRYVSSQTKTSDCEVELLKADSLYKKAAYAGNVDVYFYIAQTSYMMDSIAYLLWLIMASKESRMLYFLDMPNADMYISFAYDAMKYCYESGYVGTLMSLGRYYYYNQFNRFRDNHDTILKWISAEFIGHSYHSQAKSKEALEYFLKAYEYRSQLDSCVKVSSDYLLTRDLEYTIAECYQDNHQYDKAVEWFNLAANSGK